MFDDIPIRVWLLIAIAAIAFTPVQYLYRHFTQSPSRHDITRPVEDLSWRTSGKFFSSLAMLVALLALAIFIFTPTAEQFASSPRFWPILMATTGVWAAFTVVQGFAAGRIQPFAKGFNNTYERCAHPKRYWASMAWNGVLGCLLVWLAYDGNAEASAQAAADRCVSATDVRLLEQQLSACDDFIRLRPDDPGGYMDRGLIYLETGAVDQAASDFTLAHSLDPGDPWPLANRGIVFALKKNRASAEKDFNAVRAISPDNPVMLRGEAILRMGDGDLAGAVDRLTASLMHDPDNLWALRKRSELYWELGEHEKAIRDDQRLVQLTKQSRLRQD